MKNQKAFDALSLPGYRLFLLTFMLTMMADNIEHVISYYIIFQKFKSPALAGFAVISHWVPYLFFSVYVGALNDRFDSRRLIQIGGTLFAIVSAGWGYFFLTDTLEMHHAMALLALHGLSGVFWMTSSQVLLYDIVGQEHLASAVRLMSTVRYLAVFIGPGVGSVLMLTAGATWGMFINTAFYLPLLIWLLRAPYGRALRRIADGRKRAVKGIIDILQTFRDVRPIRILTTMIFITGAASFFIGNGYQAQMPEFAADLGNGNPGTAYSMLLAADAAGALIAGILLESRGSIFELKVTNVFILAIGWAFALLGFSLMRSYYFAIMLLFCAGFFELSFSSMAQTLVQMNAPDAIRGRVLGLYNMVGSGLRLFSGITVGLVGSLMTIHASLAFAATGFIVVCGVLLFYIKRVH
ncbi:MAG TPA: MFS transporter [Turneriella sp.]|nr:MFS transporter [Turneriella sp.]